MYCDLVSKFKSCSVLLKMGDSSIEVSEENLDAAQALKIKAMDALEKGMLAVISFLWMTEYTNYLLMVLVNHCVHICVTGLLNEAIDYLTEAITLNPHSAILYATRGNYVL